MPFDKNWQKWISEPSDFCGAKGKIRQYATAHFPAGGMGAVSSHSCAVDARNEGPYLQSRSFNSQGSEICYRRRRS